MYQDIESQLDRAKDLLHDLESSCQEDLELKTVSEKTKNLTQEVLLKIRHLLDQSIYKFFEKHYLNGLTDPDIRSAKVYFPIVPNTAGLESVLGRAKMGDLEIRHQDFYKFLESVQPDKPDYEWLKHLTNYASEKHIRLTPQKKTETKRTIVSRGNGSVSWGPGVTFGRGVSVMGVPIDPMTQMPVPNNVTETRVENWVSFLFEDTDINVLWLCKKAVEDGEKIIKEILKFVN